MAKIADVLATERNRQQPQEWNKIHLFQMGDFYRAYEWSAWLIVAITYSDKVRHQQQGDPVSASSLPTNWACSCTWVNSTSVRCIKVWSSWVPS